MRKQSVSLESFSTENSKPAPKELHFRCPECGRSELSQIVTGIRLSRDVCGVYEDGTVELGELEGPIDNENDGVFYECADCIYRLEDNAGNPVRTEQDLVKWLQDNCGQNISTVQS